MPLPIMLCIVCVLCVIGVIFLTEAVLNIILRKKTAPDAVYIYSIKNIDVLEHQIRRTVREHPASRIIIKYDSLCSDEEMLFKIIKRIYPEISIEKA